MSRMLTLATITDDPGLDKILAGATLLSWLYGIAIFLFWCLVLWVIIYTSVRAALSAHRHQQADDAEFARRLAQQRRG